MDKRLIIAAVWSLHFIAGGALAADARDGMAHLPLPRGALIAIAADMRLPHEKTPAGVPPDFDWAKSPRIGVGNEPGSFTAFTGWGQIFSVTGERAPSVHVELRRFTVLACVGERRKWVLLQDGDIEGNQYRSDYQENFSETPPLFRQKNGIAAIRFNAGTAYHFWPKQGRVDVPDKPICGVLLLLQARMPAAASADGAGAGAQAGALIGLGADFWQSRSASWDGKESNRDLAIGRLKLVGPAWQWFGMTTAPLADLRRLARFGYEVPVRDGGQEQE